MLCLRFAVHPEVILQMHLLQTHIEKGNDMLEEASLLTQSGNFDEVTGIKEITRELKTRVRTFTSRLDDLKDKIETTAQCYHMLDQVCAEGVPHPFLEQVQVVVQSSA